jgi:hypothetical protein
MFIRAHIATNTPKRFKLDGYWEVEAVKSGKLMLWSFDEPGGGTNAGKYRMYSADTFK